MRTTFLDPVGTVRDGEVLTLRVRRGDREVATLTCVVARSMLTRMRGYLVRHADHGMDGILFTHTSSVHTFGMRFALDVLHVSSDGQVLRVVRSLKPGRIGPMVRQTRFMVEVPKESDLCHAVEPGDRLEPSRLTLKERAIT